MTALDNRGNPTTEVQADSMTTPTTQARTSSGKGESVRTVGHIDVHKYRCITNDITTDEVVITDERIAHIKTRHPGHYEKIRPFLRAALETPDHILQDKKPDTALILKRIEPDDLRIQVVLRLHTSADEENRKNSIISAWKINKSRWDDCRKNKKILYSRK